MDELTLDDKKYLSSKRAAQITGYAKDYVGQLSREGRVEARLVGRNWYVLESSILEHRFGPEEPIEAQKSQAPEAVSVWEAATYSAEPVQVVPEIAPKPLPIVPAIAPAPPIPDISPVKDMQSAWSEWFERQKTQEAGLPDASEMLLADSYPDAPIETPPEPVYEPMEREPEPVAIHKRIVQPLVQEETPVRIARTSVVPQVSYIRPRSAPKKKVGGRNTQHGRSNLMTRSLFIAIAGLAIAIAVIGSGFADTYLQTSNTSSITDILGGVNNISK